MASAEQGFTLLEMMVTVAIIGIFSAFSLAAYPQLRANQLFSLTEQQLQSQLSAASASTFNGELNQDCVDAAEDVSSCDQYGVTLLENRAIVFVDGNDSKAFEEGDFVVSEIILSESLEIQDWEDVVFVRSLPRLQLLVAASEVESDTDESAVFSLNLNEQSRSFRILPLGSIIREDDE